MDASDRKLVSDVRTYGWHVVLVPEDEEGPGFGFSIGFYHTLKHPEVLMFGLELPVTHRIINNIGADIRSGTVFESGKEYPDILEGYRCAFRTVPTRWYREYLGSARWFYKGDNF